MCNEASSKSHSRAQDPQQHGAYVALPDGPGAASGGRSAPSAPSPPPPAYDEYEPGLSYDAQAYQWAFPAASSGGLHAPGPALDPRAPAAVQLQVDAVHPDFDHAAELDRRQTSVGRWSLGLFIVMLIVLLVGQFALHRTVGPFVITDIVLALVFAYGVFLLRVHDRALLRSCLHIYFGCAEQVKDSPRPITLYSPHRSFLSCH